MEHQYIEKLQELCVLHRFKQNCDKLNPKGYIGVVLWLQFQTDDGVMPTFERFVKTAFDWGESHEGRKYWKRIANS